MSAPNPFAGNSTIDFTADEWRQVVAATDPGDINLSGDGGGEAIIVGTKVPFNKINSFARYWLGWNACSLSGGTMGVTLQRTLPKRHPILQELSADTVHGQPFKPDSTSYQASPFFGLKRFLSNYLIIPAAPFFSGYRYVKASIGFKDQIYELLDDDVMAGFIWTQSYTDSNGVSANYSFPMEWVRFTTFDPAPRVEALALEGFRMVYAEGTGNTGATTNPKGTKVPAPAGQLLVKADLAITTFKLPNEFLFGNGGTDILPRNIIAGLGRVNRFAIFGQPAGTLLFIGCEMSKRRFSLRAPSETRYLWQVRYLFSFFDPPKGYDNDSYPTRLATNRGHNNLFYMGARDPNGTVVSADKNSMQWFFATASGNPSDPGLLPPFDIAQLWRPVCNAAGTVTNPVYQ